MGKVTVVVDQALGSLVVTAPIAAAAVNYGSVWVSSGDLRQQEGWRASQ